MQTGNESAQIVQFLFTKYIESVNKKLQDSHLDAQSGIATISPEYITIFFDTKKLVIRDPIMTSEVSFGHHTEIFDQAAQAILDFAGHCDLQCLVETVPTV